MKVLSPAKLEQNGLKVIPPLCGPCSHLGGCRSIEIY
ncbi:hypothetical protein Thebr_0976 [Thermoanaerobacter brockii subsp. finnii Ako-1]|uniref:Uncharacterized protein n=1 Tax=Thermoanaerobacter brockii subsp. finnii (strain ATCC 43586 / DSM 3389 / AKO-1) TaxID=509193 RepID=E8URV6_THEBF|nr:hypothetical protein Thebr_0976 [Thermoanaerobacter brockii subsp. finnii Ako-1]